MENVANGQHLTYTHTHNQKPYICVNWFNWDSSKTSERTTGTAKTLDER